MTQNTQYQPQYERSDTSKRNLFLTAGTILVIIAIIIVALNEIFIATTENKVYETVLTPESTELRNLRANETKVLNSYKLLDESQEILQIPIDRAMQLMAESRTSSLRR